MEFIREWVEGFLRGRYGLRLRPLAVPVLIGAILTGANLRGTDLRNADFSLARAITAEELEQQTDLLAGATMPNGHKYEDWLKSRGQDGENE